VGRALTGENREHCESKQRVKSKGTGERVDRFTQTSKVEDKEIMCSSRSEISHGRSPHPLLDKKYQAGLPEPGSWMKRFISLSNNKSAR
jgi:hypothetical protein